MENSEVQTKPIENAVEPEVRKPRRKGLIIGGVIALIALLGGAAFVGGQLLSKQAEPGGLGGSVVMVGGAGGDVATSGGLIEIVSAKELPATPPDVSGLFAERKDNSLFVTVGDGTFVGLVDENGTVSTQVGGNAQKIEVVVTNDTQLYKEVTEMLTDGKAPADGKVQQKVAPGSLDEIGQNSFVTAWGERRGDRLIAKMLLYTPPMIMAAPLPAAP